MPSRKRTRLAQSEMYENRKKSKPSQQMSEDGPTSEQNVKVNQSSANMKGSKFKPKCNTNHMEHPGSCDMEQKTENQTSNHYQRQSEDSISSVSYEGHNSAEENNASTTRRAKSGIPVKQEFIGKDKKRDKHPDSHATKVKIPRQRTIRLGPESRRNEKCTIGLDSINWARECLALSDSRLDRRASDHSAESVCRICYGCERGSAELGPLVSACHCRGSVGRVHVKCLERWLSESGKTRCEICNSKYATRRFHRYGVMRALFVWVLSQNRKQLLVDVFGILLMSPLAVLAAWLSANTLSGLMAPDPQTTPWPLASTFVLACMTLVCYYCWIASAASRHVLAWWVWYRAQYEVRLLCADEDD